MAKKERIPLFDTSDDRTLRIQGELAGKIGLNESIILMQLEYLISISNHQIDDRLWTYQTLEELKASFPWWSIATISRGIKSLESQGLIFVDSFNKRKGDKTQWFALNLEKIAELECIKLNDNHPIFQYEKRVIDEPIEQAVKAIEDDPIFHFDDTIFQDEKSIFQNETTLPKTTTKITTEITTPNGVGGELPPPKIGPKTQVKDTFIELTNLPMPKPKSDYKFWWGKFGEILTLARGDPVLACQWQSEVICYMRESHLTVTGPQSIIGLIRVLASGQPLQYKNGTTNNGQYKNNTQRNTDPNRIPSVNIYADDPLPAS